MFFISLTMLSACVPSERQLGWSVGYGRSYRAPVAVTMPANAYSITQQFRRSDLYQSAHYVGDHFGLDVQAPIGTPILAAADGRVVASVFGAGYGHRISIVHDQNGKAPKAQTNYLHLQSRLVSVGDHVLRGQQIGTMGASGITAGGLPHLHFEVLIQGTALREHAQDPHLFWVNGKGNVTCFMARHRHMSSQTFAITYPVECQ